MLNHYMHDCIQWLDQCSTNVWFLSLAWLGYYYKFFEHSLSKNIRRTKRWHCIGITNMNFCYWTAWFCLWSHKLDVQWEDNTTKFHATELNSIILIIRNMCKPDFIIWFWWLCAWQRLQSIRRLVEGYRSFWMFLGAK